MDRENNNGDLEQYQRWDTIKRREQAHLRAQESDDEEVVEVDGTVALVNDVEQDDEWFVMDDVPDEYQFGE